MKTTKITRKRQRKGRIVKTEKGSGKSASPSKTPNKSPTNVDKGDKAEESNEVRRWWEEERHDDGVKGTFLEHEKPKADSTKKRKQLSDDEDDEDYEEKPKKKKKKVTVNQKRGLGKSASPSKTPHKTLTNVDKGDKAEESNEVWKWWEEERHDDGVEGTFFEHEKPKADSTKKRKQLSDDEDDEDYEEKPKKKKKKVKTGSGKSASPRKTPHKTVTNVDKGDKAEGSNEVWRWWEEERHDDGVKGTLLEHEKPKADSTKKRKQLSDDEDDEDYEEKPKHKDWQKYETARRLHKTVDKIRAQYREDWTSKEMRVRQRAVALYFIDKLAFRTGSEKEEGETADTVGCCSLCNEHLTLHEKYEEQENVVEFDFLGKDSIRYYNRVTVEKRVFKNLQLFMKNKSGEDEVFDRLNTEILNKYLNELMEGLAAKVFRTYNASHTLQEQLNLLTEPEDTIPAKILSYNRANRAVAILCNHQRAAPKNFSKQMENLQVKIDDKKAAIKEAKKLMKDAKSDYKNHISEKTKSALEKRKKAVQRLEEQLTKLEVQATDKEENKEIALGTSKLNYLDPRISVAWCKKWEVPIEKIYNKMQREKFRWAMDMATAEFEF